MKFEWDPAKTAANLKKHEVAFEEAQTAFFDEAARIIFDPDHGESEDRFILMGMSRNLRILTVCHCFRQGEVIRLISARVATKGERKFYTGDDHA